jgi:hypothetical protein
MLALLLSFSPVAGCGPAIAPEDLGTVLEEVPEVPGTQQPYELPKSGSVATADEETPEPDSGP